MGFTALYINIRNISSFQILNIFISNPYILIMKITKAELLQIIKEEVKTYKRVKLLENRKAQILIQLNEMNETSTKEENMEEGLFGKMFGIMSSEEKSKIIDQLITSRYKGIITQAAQSSGKDPNGLSQELKDFIIKSKLPIEKDKFGNFTAFVSGNPANFYYDAQNGWQTGSKLATTMSHMMREDNK